MTAPRVLVVEDDALVAEILQLNLPRDGWAVTLVRTAADCLQALRRELPDVVVLDLTLPDMSGIELCRQIRAGIVPGATAIPVLMLTARASQFDKLSGFDAGTDDYLTKPFDPLELDARLKALHKRSSGKSPTGGRLELHNLTLCLKSHEVYFCDQPVALNPQEFDLLFALARNPGTVFSRQELLEMVWGYSVATSSRTVDIHISRLRKKLRDAAPESESAQPIHTVHGIGYKLEVYS